jgi:hypothetical protein
MIGLQAFVAFFMHINYEFSGVYFSIPPICRSNNVDQPNFVQAKTGAPPAWCSAIR